MIEYDKRTCHYEDTDKGCTYFDCDDCRYFYKDKEKNMSDLDIKIYSVNQAIKMEELAHNKAIDKCKQILIDAMARDGKTKCHEYMIAINEMEKLKL